MADMKFNEMELILKVNDHSNDIKMLKEYIETIKEENKRQDRIMSELGKSLTEVNNTLSAFSNKVEGARWAMLKFWSLVVGLAFLINLASKYVTILK